MGLFDAEDSWNSACEWAVFTTSYESIADKFRSMFDLPIPLLVEDHRIELEKELEFSPELVGLKRENIPYYDLSKPNDPNHLGCLLRLAFLWTTEGIILNNIDKIDPANSGVQDLLTSILTEEDMSGKATFYGNPPSFLPKSKKADEKIRERWDTSPEAPGIPKKTGRIRVALVCKEFPEYLKDKNIFCSKILMGKK